MVKCAFGVLVVRLGHGRERPVRRRAGAGREVDHEGDH